jgi:hypothetical protein
VCPASMLQVQSVQPALELSRSVAKEAIRTSRSRLIRSCACSSVTLKVISLRAESDVLLLIASRQGG